MMVQVFHEIMFRLVGVWFAQHRSIRNSLYYNIGPIVS